MVHYWIYVTLNLEPRTLNAEPGTLNPEPVKFIKWQNLQKNEKG